MFMHVSQTTKNIVREFDPQFVELCNCALRDHHGRQQAQRQLDEACSKLERNGIVIADIYPLIECIAPGFRLKSGRLEFYHEGEHRPCASLKYLLMMIEPYLMYMGVVA